MTIQDEVNRLAEQGLNAGQIALAMPCVTYATIVGAIWKWRKRTGQPYDNPWTPERIELLRKLWAENWPASRIAQELGPWCTKNAAIGKAHRLHLPSRPSRSANGRKSVCQPRVERLSAPRKPLVPRMEPKPMQTTLYPSTPAPIPVPAEPSATRITLMQLRADTCRFPIGDPREASFRFCGEPCSIDVSYCPACSKICYVSALDRRARQAKRAVR